MNKILLSYRLDNPDDFWLNPIHDYRYFLMEMGEHIFWDNQWNEPNIGYNIKPYHWAFPFRNIGYIYIEFELWGLSLNDMLACI